MTTETAPQTEFAPPPPHQVETILQTPEEQLKIRFTTFEDAHQASKKFSDEFIDGCLSGSHSVGAETVGTKGFLDKVETTPTDESIINDPEAIAATYLATSDMVARSLRLMTKPGMTTERKYELKTAKESYLSHLGDETQAAADQIIGWTEDPKKRFPVAATEYQGFKVDGKDPLDAMGKDAEDFRPNIKVQRQIGGTFIMAYSDARTAEKLSKRDEDLTQRIYLNPDMLATPEIFEKLLQAANAAGLSMQLKVFQRAPELAGAHVAKQRGRAVDSLRGDGIVMYAHEDTADDVLGLALAIAKDHPEAFVGRKTSRIPQRVAEGIAIGDEPNQDGKSLTSHRAEILEHVAHKVNKSGKTGQDARDSFRRGVKAISSARGVDADNIAFNLPETT